MAKLSQKLPNINAISIGLLCRMIQTQNDIVATPSTAYTQFKQTTLLEFPASEEEIYFKPGLTKMLVLGLTLLLPHSIRFNDDFWSKGVDDNITARDKARKIYNFFLDVAGRPENTYTTVNV
jgi:hypothetical protein